MQTIPFSTEGHEVKESSAKKNIVRSPLFYVGDKYKLMDQLK